MSHSAAYLYSACTMYFTQRRTYTYMHNNNIRTHRNYYYGCACDRVGKPVLSIIIDSGQPSENCSGAFVRSKNQLREWERACRTRGKWQHGRLLTSDNRYLLLPEYYIVVCYICIQHTTAYLLRCPVACQRTVWIFVDIFLHPTPPRRRFHQDVQIPPPPSYSRNRQTVRLIAFCMSPI